MLRTPVVAMIITAALLTLNVQAARKYVVPGDFNSIQSAIEKAEDKDTVFVKNGIYKEHLTLKDDIVLMGESSNGTIIHGKTSSAVIKASNGTVISRLTVENGNQGILCENTSTVIENVIARNNQTGIQCLISLPVIRNNLIYRNKGTGIYCESVRSIKSGIEHNVVAENGYSGITLAGRSEVLIENNMIFANKQYGIWATEDSRRSRIIYNNIYNNRNANNFYALIDRTNIAEDPVFPSEKGSYEYFGVQSVALKGKGKDGATIGMVSEQEITKEVNDPDGDEVVGAADKCPSITEDSDGFEDEDGCPDFDNDNDGIYDTQDKCANEAEDIDGFMDEDGCADIDNDGDGIADKNDLCPMNAEVKNGYKDDDGCPDAAPGPGDKGTSSEKAAPSSSDKSSAQTPAADKPAVPADTSNGKAAK